ncbi:MAG: deoxynucleoside kinase [Candidatus Marsarchaeota archaeon]|nr:deoxynucleoside kinase [Candidatus Marsarchaeota archaeon]
MLRIALEGVDGAGKTTQARLLKEKTGGVIIKDCPPEFLSLLRPSVERNAEKHQGTYFTYHLGAVIYADLKARSYLRNNPNGTVIFDRSLYSVLAVQMALDELFNNSTNEALIRKIATRTLGKITEADKVVFLEVEEKDRLIRLSKRGDKNALSDSRVRFTQILRHKLNELASIRNSSATDILQINTSAFAPEETADMINRYLEHRTYKSGFDAIPKKSRLIVDRTFGAVGESSKPIFLLWAHTEPKLIYLDFLSMSKLLFNKLPTVLIDDMAPRFIENRSLEEQHKITANFKEFFSRYGCATIVLSEVFDKDDFAKTIDRIKLPRLIHALPKASLEELQTGNPTNQMIHFRSNMYALKVGLKYGDVILAGKRDIGIFFAFYEIHKKLGLKTRPNAVFCSSEVI